MDFAADFTAIDFETASRRDDSACQLGLVTVREGRMIDQASWLIRPKPLYFHPVNIGIHGITPEQVRDAPEFADLWPEIAEKIGNDCLVAHNASFDLRVLLATLRSHRQTIPELSFTCTRAIARRTWPHHRRYGLQPLSQWLGIRFRHHDALEDAVACAKILLAAGIDREARSLAELERRLRLKRGQAGAWGIRGPAGGYRSRTRSGSATPLGSGPRLDNGGLPFVLPDQLIQGNRKPPNPRGDETVGGQPAASFIAARSHAEALTSPPPIDLQRLMIRAEFIRPLAGMRVVVSGRFRHLTLEDARTLAIRSGAECQEAVDEATHVLVLGEPTRARSTSRVAEAAPSIENDVSFQQQAGQTQASQQRAHELREAGQSIQVVDEEEFLRLVSGSDAASRNPRADVGAAGGS